MTKRSVGWLVAGVLILCLGAGVIVALLPQERHLARLAKRVAATNDWEPRVSKIPGTTRYFWLSDHEVLFFRGVRWRTGLQAFRLDTRTGKETTLPIKTNPNRWSYQDFLTAPSPDGRRLLYLNDRPDRGQRFLVVRDVNTGREIAWPCSRWHGFMRWLPDSRSFVVHRVSRQGRASEVFRLDAPPPAGGERLTRPNAFPFLGYTADGQCLGADFGGMQGMLRTDGIQLGDGFAEASFGKRRDVAVDFVVYDPVLATKPPRRFTIHPPPGAERVSITLSPKGDRLAWLVRHRRRSNLYLERLALLFRFRPPVPRDAYSLWVSRVDGSEMREVGYMDSEPRVPVPGPPYWAPDGRRVSFLYDESLWVVPVE